MYIQIRSTTSYEDCLTDYMKQRIVEWTMSCGRAILIEIDMTGAVINIKKITVGVTYKRPQLKLLGDVMK